MGTGLDSLNLAVIIKISSIIGRKNSDLRLTISQVIAKLGVSRPPLLHGIVRVASVSALPLRRRGCVKCCQAWPIESDICLTNSRKACWVNFFASPPWEPLAVLSECMQVSLRTRCIQVSVCAQMEGTPESRHGICSTNSSCSDLRSSASLACWLGLDF